MNNITITGNLTKDPMTSRTPSDKLVATGTIAVNRQFGKEADFFDFDVWENQAEYLSKYARKGDRVELVGSMENHKYQRKDGTTSSKWVVKVIFVNVISSKGTASQEEVEETFDSLNIDELDDDMPF